MVYRHDFTQMQCYDYIHQILAFHIAGGAPTEFLKLDDNARGRST